MRVISLSSPQLACDLSLLCSLNVHLLQKEEDFLQQLQVARQEQMGPLSAASMEMGSYHRGYECILRLEALLSIRLKLAALFCCCFLSCHACKLTSLIVCFPSTNAV